MTTPFINRLPALGALPATLPHEGAINLELAEGVLIFRVSSVVQHHIETLVEKERAAGLSAAETDELQRYEDIDDYLSLLNRLVRNFAAAPTEGRQSLAS